MITAEGCCIVGLKLCTMLFWLFIIRSIFFDWFEFGYEVIHHGQFAGVPTNSTVVKVLLGCSCGFGSSCSAVMAIVYGYYIFFHWKCIHNGKRRSYRHVNFRYESQSERLIKCNVDNDSGNKSAPCNRHFVLTELVISNIELYFKDGVQSILLMYMYSVSKKDPSSLILVHWRDIVFAVCCILGHLKLYICFITKLFGCGSGEKMPECESAKCLLCVLGSFGSLAFIILSILYLTLSLSW